MAAEQAGELPEFHIVVTRPTRHGPLAPYRFAISMVVAVLVTFDDLCAALFRGAPTDAVLLRAVTVAVFAWVVLSVLNRVLASAVPAPSRSSAEPAQSSGAPTAR
jgi:hypothetical protein